MGDRPDCSTSRKISHFVPNRLRNRQNPGRRLLNCNHFYCTQNSHGLAVDSTTNPSNLLNQLANRGKVHNQCSIKYGEHVNHAPRNTLSAEPFLAYSLRDHPRVVHTDSPKLSHNALEGSSLITFARNFPAGSSSLSLRYMQ